MSESVRIVVEGVPAPKGSFRISSRGRGRKPIVRKDSPKTEAWESSVKWGATHWMRGHGRTPFVGRALSLSVYFRLPRPDGHFVHAVHGALIRKSKLDINASVKPDIDKLLRSTLDALEGIVYDQDSRIVSVKAHKGYVKQDETPGAVITVEPYGGNDDSGEDFWSSVEKAAASVEKLPAWMKAGIVVDEVNFEGPKKARRKR